MILGDPRERDFRVAREAAEKHPLFPFDQRLLTRAAARVTQATAGDAAAAEQARLMTELYVRGPALRVGIIYRLESVSEEPVPASRFAIPSPLLSREELADRLH